MAGKMTVFFVLAAIAMVHFEIAHSNPAIATVYEPVRICIENCAQCKKVLGAYFDGPLCAEFCFKFKGELIPDWEKIETIKPFINKI